uniref:Mid2 domain-containing protein n=1 Tax=Moniliophthora roreri TaxID=221103 RepID=A0A0W0F7Z1_MONRR
MLFLICRILVVVALAKAIQAQGTFSGIPDKTVAGSQLNVGFQYSGSVRIGDVSFDFIRDGGSTQRRTIRIRLGISAQLRIQTLTVPRVAGRVQTGVTWGGANQCIYRTYRVQATYDDSSGNTHRDLSSPFIAFAEGEDPGVLPEPSSTATPSSISPSSVFPSSTTSESSTQSTSEPTAVTEQTTSESSTSIAVDTDPTFSRIQTSTSSGISTGMSSTGTGQRTIFASSTETGQPTTSTISATQSSAVSSRNSKPKAAIIAGSVVGTATLIVLLALIAVRRRHKKKTYRDGLSVQPYTFDSHLEKRRKLREVEESRQEEGEEGVREARSEVASRVHANRVRQSIVVVHEDSGWRPDQTSTAGDARVVDLPPGYDAAR